MRRLSWSLAVLGVCASASCADLIGATFGDYQGPSGSGAGGAGGSTTTTAAGGGGASVTSTGGAGGGSGGNSLENCDTAADEGGARGNAECGAIVNHHVLTGAILDEMALAPGGSGGLAFGSGLSSSFPNGQATHTSKTAFVYDFTLQPPAFVSLLEPEGITSSNVVRIFDLVQGAGSPALFVGAYRGMHAPNPDTTVYSGLFGRLNAADWNLVDYELVAPGATGPDRDVVILDLAVTTGAAYVLGYAEADVLNATHPIGSSAYVFVSRLSLNGNSAPVAYQTQLLGFACSPISGDQLEGDVQLDSQGRVWVAGPLCGQATLPGSGETLQPTAGRDAFVSVWKPDLTWATGVVVDAAEVRVAGLAPANADTMMLAMSFSTTLAGHLKIGAVDESGSDASSLDVALTRFSATNDVGGPAIEVGHTRIYGGPADDHVTGIRVLESELSKGVFISGYYEKHGIIDKETGFDDWLSQLGEAEKKAFVLKSEWLIGATPALDTCHAIWARFLGDTGRTEAHDVLVLGDEVWLAGAVGQATVGVASSVTLSSNVSVSASMGEKKWFLADFSDQPSP